MIPLSALLDPQELAGKHPWECGILTVPEVDVRLRKLLRGDFHKLDNPAERPMCFRLCRGYALLVEEGVEHGQQHEAVAEGLTAAENRPG